jgi:arylsulfatase A-like enzyme
VPLIIRDGRRGNGPAIVSRLVGNHDYLPTLLELARIPFDPDAFDGRSMVPLLADPDGSAWTRNVLLLEHWRAFDQPDSQEQPSYFGMRSESRAYFETSDALLYGGPRDSRLIGLEYYQLDSDPHQLDSWYTAETDAPPERLHSLLERLKRCGNGTCRQIEDDVAALP